MSLPPGFLDELRARVSIAQVAGRKVTWDQRKSNQGRGDFWAPCPFHQEKTASFHVDDRKGFFHCFGCHEGGDAISFVQKTENMGFMEAVELLAGEAGLPMPARDPSAREAADRRSVLTDVMEQAVRHYRLQLKTGQAARARDYLSGRGLDEAALERWEIGFAPDARQGLFSHLRAKGAPEDAIVSAGLAARPDDGGAPYDRFRGRIVFPIRDPRGRAIAFGGRAMDPNARAKYLNSPETELFDKGQTLFNHGPAREAAGRGSPLIVAEGYMDVIALVEAGFAAAVAPLGTAITERQLEMLWRISDEPVVALDGDRAGLEAGLRLMALALPRIEAGRSLRFCLMPDKMDPDDLIRSQGPEAMRNRLEAAVPMIELFWRRETEGQVFDSPERRAALDRRLRAGLREIRDESLRRHWEAAIAERRQALFAPAGGRNRRFAAGRDRQAVRQPTPAARASLLAQAPDQHAENLREAVVLAVLLRHPDLVTEFERELESFDSANPEHCAIAAMLLNAHAGNGDHHRVGLDEALEKLLALGHVRIAPGVRTADIAVARQCLAEDLGRIAAIRGARAETAYAERDLEGFADEGLTWRLTKAAEAVAEAGRRADGDLADYLAGENGMRIRRDEREAFEALLGRIGNRNSEP